MDEFEKTTNIRADYQAPETKQEEVDGILKFTHNKKKYKFYIEAKKELRNHQLTELEKLDKKFNPLIVIGQYIFPKIKTASTIRI